jgi:queuine tRNA-ribosyltransferase
MPVGTRGTVRGLTPDELAGAGTAMVLANAYHLWVRPGHEVVAELGGLHRFMGWTGPLLTDSGGYQVFSLSDRIELSEEGARIRAVEDGAWRLLTPEGAVEIQETLGVDVAMALDECLVHDADRDRAGRSTERTTRWLKRGVAARRHPERTALFGIAQGGLFHDLRDAHAREIALLDLDGYAIGGLSTGEDRDALVASAAVSAAALPEDRVRYLMGVGQPIDIADAILSGVDLFDCVLPTRAGRHGQAYTSEGRRNLKNARYRSDPAPLDPACTCTCCRTFARGALRHLVQAEELLGKRLLALHNVTFYQDLVRGIRAAITSGDPARLAECRARAAVATTPAAE